MNIIIVIIAMLMSLASPQVKDPNNATIRAAVRSTKCLDKSKGEWKAEIRVTTNLEQGTWEMRNDGWAPNKVQKSSRPFTRTIKSTEDLVTVGGSVDLVNKEGNMGRMGRFQVVAKKPKTCN